MAADFFANLLLLSVMLASPVILYVIYSLLKGIRDDHRCVREILRIAKNKTASDVGASEAAGWSQTGCPDSSNITQKKEDFKHEVI